MSATAHQFYSPRKPSPDWHNIADAALRRLPKRLPLYEHVINGDFIEAFTGNKLNTPDPAGRFPKGDWETYFYNTNKFYMDMGYDTISSELCVGGFFPGGGSLGDRSIPPVIKTREDFNNYDFAEVVENFKKTAVPYFDAMATTLPDGMKYVGGVGNGMFECVQNIAGFDDLFFMQADDPECYDMLFAKVADVIYQAWEFVLSRWADIFCVYRFGDDLGFKSATMMTPDDIRTNIIPHYARIIGMIKRKTGKPFLLHSCGCLTAVMDDIIGAGIDAKHSNEDVIMPFPQLVELYGGRIALFGGIDTDALCDVSGIELEPYVRNLIDFCIHRPGIALGSGNSIPGYVSHDRYAKANEMIRRARGE